MAVANAEYLGLIGKSFSVAELGAMKLSLLVLGERLHSKVAVWGKIMGINADYLVASTQPDNIADSRLYYYSVDGGSNWTLLPTASLTAAQSDLAEELRGRFFGKPDFEYKVRRDVPAEAAGKSLIPAAEGDLLAKDGAEEGEEPEDEDEDANGEEENEENEDAEDAEEEDDEELKRLKNKPKYQILKLTEAVRVAHFVVAHDLACRLTVRGAYVLNEKTNQIVRNRTFEGIDVAQALKLRSFAKISSFPVDSAAPAAASSEGDVEAAAKVDDEVAEGQAAAPAELTVEERKAIISENNRKWFGPSYSYTTDFLQVVSEDQPNGVWVVKYDASLPAVSVQNLYFNGSLFFYVPETATFGQLYCGTGERNLDLCYQLPCR